MLIVDKNSQFYSICAIKKGGNTDSGQRNFHIGKFFSSKLLFFEIKNIEPIFPWKVKNMKKCSNHEKLRTIEAHTKITGSYNKKVYIYCLPKNKQDPKFPNTQGSKFSRSKIPNS